MEVPATPFDDLPPWRYFAIVPLIFVAGLVALGFMAACLAGLIWFYTVSPFWAGWTVRLTVFVGGLVTIRTFRARHLGSE